MESFQVILSDLDVLLATGGGTRVLNAGGVRLEGRTGATDHVLVPVVVFFLVLLDVVLFLPYFSISFGSENEKKRKERELNANI